MKVLVSGSSGHLGEALVRTLNRQGHAVVGVDVVQSPFTTHVGSITSRAVARACMRGVEAVLHTATLHKPHVFTHSPQAFVDANITGTLNLLEEAVAANVRAFIFTSTTSAFGNALTPPPGKPAAWITEEIAPQPKNIYASPRRRQKISANCSAGTRACLALYFARPASSPSRTTTRSHAARTQMPI